MHFEWIRLIHHMSGDMFLNLKLYFLWFCIYGFMGWLYESTVCSQVKYHRFINRGYLRGPICPIYGIGAVANFLLLGQTKSISGIFLAAMLISGVVEYFTSYAMERAFRQRWWDYTRYRFNLHGRICLYGCLIFGIANVIILKVIHPAVMYLTGRISELALTRIALFLYLLLLLDVIYTTLHMEAVNQRMKVWGIRLREKRENLQWIKVPSWSNEPKIGQIVPKLKESRCYEWLERIKDRLAS